MATSSSLQDYAIHAATVLGTDAETSITIRQHGAAVRAASSSEAAGRCDRAEVLAQEGPCIDAMNELRTRVVPDLAAEDRWQEWRKQAVHEGFATAIAVPAHVGDGVQIALNMYARGEEVWDARVLASSGAYAQLVAAAVRMQLKVADLEDKADGLYRRMSDAVAIERAVGTIMQTNDCSAEDAERILGSAARHRGVSRRTVAETILRSLETGHP